MRLSWWVPLVLGLLCVAAPAWAQEAQPEPAPPSSGLVIVGHGPDAPNVSTESTPVYVAPPVMVVIVPVPIVVERPHHHREPAAASAPAAVPAPTPALANPFGRFINDPFRRFVNPIVPPPTPNS